MRWLIALAVLFASGRADAGTFKARGGDKNKPAAKTPAKTEPKKTEKTDADKKPVAAKAPAKKAPAKKKPASQVATKGRPDDLTPNPKKKGDVKIIEDNEEDVIIRDLDD